MLFYKENIEKKAHSLSTNESVGKNLPTFTTQQSRKHDMEPIVCD